MPQKLTPQPQASMRLAAHLLLVCGVVLGFDIGGELHAFVLFPQSFSGFASFHLLLEVLASLGMGWAFILIRRHDRQTSRAHQVDLDRLHALRKDFDTLIHKRFALWGMSQAECDVAILTLRGLKISEIAHLRHTQEGTIKSQLSSIFRKSGASTRTEFVARFMDEFLDQAASDGSAP